MALDPGFDGARAADDTRLGRRAGRALRWSFAIRLAERSIGFVRLLVLARLLAPADFGLFGIAALMLTGVEAFTQTGTMAALVRRPVEARSLYDVAWSIQLLRGLLVAAAVALAAPLAAAFFDRPDAAPLIAAIGLVALARAFTNVAVVELDRALDFRGRFLYMTTGSVVDVAVSIAVAVVWRTPWALLLGMLAGNLVRAALSHVVVRHRLRVRWDREAARELLVFGGWLGTSTALIYLVTSLDDVVVAKLLGAAALGLYQVAYLLANLPATQVTQAVSEVTLPLYGILHDDAERTRRTYLRSVEAVLILVLPAAVAIMLLADPLARVAFGVEWLGMVPALQVLGLTGALRAFGAANGALFSGRGVPRLETWTTAIHLVLMTLLLYPAISRFGMAGAAWAVTLPMAISQAFGVRQSMSLLQLRARTLAAHMAAPLMLSLATGALILAIGALLDTPVAVLAVSLIVVPAACLALLRYGAVDTWTALREVLLPTPNQDPSIVH